MAVGIDVPAGVTDWVSYLTTTWLGAYEYRGNGFFNSSTPYTQWAAGDLTNSAESGVILNGSFTYAPPGGFSGTLSSLEFGTNLSGSASAGYDISEVLRLDLSGATATTAFTYAIYFLSTQGNLSYLWSYLSEQGTTQAGNDGAADTLYSFSGDDTLTGGTGADTFVFDADYVGVTGDWGNDTITDFTDGVDKIKFVDLWLDYSDFTSDTSVTVSGNVITYVDSSTSTTNTITLTGFAGTLDSSDFIFA
ncbi:M10 family metallopeptidase C-terminal domain-containing protein [Agrobacterium sp. OT33]|uniref:M10 family metallopeptidase C-terminal domain-containing protein n=1 Tax=Agrobacterium sp. OT33 TaxID=2815338 RepID=UPI001A903AA0|nr:hypothetical protein [Agrobacterium sp. OT33]MBO0128370.1 hypothetical protein [Agrobacterium sp. OT33]